MKDEKFIAQIGKRIRDRRKELGLSQVELGKKVGYTSSSTLSYIECGKRDIPTQQLSKIAKALNTTTDYLMGLDKEVQIKLQYDDEVKGKVRSHILFCYEKLTDENKLVLEKYIQYLLDSQEG